MAAAVTLSLVVGFCARAIAERYPTHKPSPPRLAVRAVAPTIIRVQAETASTDSVYQVALHRTDAGGSEWTSWISNGFGYKGHKGSRVDPAQANTTYTYRAMGESGSEAVSNSDWSEPITVTTPPEPTTAPRAPTGIRAYATSSFAVELVWNDRSDNEYGFEVQRKWKDAFIQVALIDPNVHHFQHHGRRPGEANAYRVRAFNPRGASEFTQVVVATTPRLQAGLTSADKRQGPGVCTAPQRVQTQFAAMWGDLQWDMYRHTVKMGKHVVDLFPDFTAGCCGAQNGRFKAFARYGGCYREIGDLSMLVDGTFGEITTDREGWSVIRTSTHWRCGLGAVLIYQFVRGRYVEADRYMYCAECGEEERDLKTTSPPFCDGGNCDVCQEDLHMDAEGESQH